MEYTGAMREHIITNPVPTPEEMAARLGISLDRVAVLRQIMRSPSPSSKAEVKRQATGLALRKRVSRTANVKGRNAKAAAR
jgi:hypothetical protein